MSNSYSITRRNFLELGSAALGGSLLACGGLSFVATREPEIERTQNNYGGKSPMSDRILVAYASKSGTTVDVAQAIGKSLSDQGATVDVKPAKAVTSLEGYRAVVIGSGIRMGQWLPEAVGFVKTHQAKLHQLPIAYFTVHLLHLDDGEESRTIRATFTEPVRRILAPKTEVFFAGRLAYSKLSLIELMLAKAMKAQEQDLRDWNKIHAWAEGLAPTFGLAAW
jgi:menaquinone-dependent protoporphyrinogen oxidase